MIVTKILRMKKFRCILNLIFFECKQNILTFDFLTKQSSNFTIKILLLFFNWNFKLLCQHIVDIKVSYRTSWVGWRKGKFYVMKIPFHLMFFRKLLFLYVFNIFIRMRIGKFSDKKTSKRLCLAVLLAEMISL